MYHSTAAKKEMPWPKPFSILCARMTAVDTAHAWKVIRPIQAVWVSPLQYKYCSLSFLFLGICSCDDNYEGEDCSVSTNTAPVLYYLSNGGLCDSSIDACPHTVIFGEKFGGQETCHVTSLQVDNQAPYTHHTNEILIAFIKISSFYFCTGNFPWMVIQGYCDDIFCPDFDHTGSSLPSAHHLACHTSLFCAAQSFLPLSSQFILHLLCVQFHVP